MAEQIPLGREPAAHPWTSESFAIIAAKAREVLRERGYSEEQIDIELKRSKRAQFDD